MNTDVFMVRDKNFWKIFERTKCGPKGEGHEARNKDANNANKKTTKSIVVATRSDG